MVRSMSNYWVVAIPEENWKVIRDKKKWGYKENLEDLIRKEDVLIFYVTKSSSKELGGNFVGAAKIVGDWKKEEKELLWPDEKEKGKVIYPYRVSIELTKEGKASVDELVNKLSFIKNKEKWKVYFRNTPCNFRKPISENDAKIIIDSI